MYKGLIVGLTVFVLGPNSALAMKKIVEKGSRQKERADFLNENKFEIEKATRDLDRIKKQIRHLRDLQNTLLRKRGELWEKQETVLSKLLKGQSPEKYIPYDGEVGVVVSKCLNGGFIGVVLKEVPLPKQELFKNEESLVLKVPFYQVLEAIKTDWQKTGRSNLPKEKVLFYRFLVFNCQKILDLESLGDLGDESDGRRIKPEGVTKEISKEIPKTLIFHTFPLRYLGTKKYL